MNTTENAAPSENLFHVRELRGIAGLTYRQINDWEAKGVIPRSREGDNQWRTFSISQIFGLAVLAEIRKKFGVPLNSLRWLGSVLMAEDSKLLYWSVGQMAMKGIPAILVTDLNKTFRVVNSIELGELLADGSFPPPDADAFVMIKLNDIAKCVLDIAGLPPLEHFQMRPVGFEWTSGRLAQNPEEEKVLSLMRSIQFDKLEIDLAKGQVRLLTAEQAITCENTQDLRQLLGTASYQTVEIVEHDGKVVRALRKIKIKPEEIRLRLAAQRKDPER